MVVATATIRIAIAQKRDSCPAFTKDLTKAFRCGTLRVTMKNYDKKVKQTRILLSDYLVLKQMSQLAGVSMSEALHRLIEHQAQLPLLGIEIKPAPVVQVTGIPTPALRVTGLPRIAIKPVAVIATNGSKVAAFRIKTKGVRYD